MKSYLIHNFSDRKRHIYVHSVFVRECFHGRIGNRGDHINH